MNEIIIRNINLFFSVNDYLKQFVGCMMIFLMNMFFEYDQFFLTEIFSKFDQISNVNKIDSNDNFFAKSHQLCNAVHANNNSNSDKSYFKTNHAFFEQH